MKVTKNLLKAIAVGVALGTSFTACEVFEDVSPETRVEEISDSKDVIYEAEADAPRGAVDDGTCDNGHNNCPACGLG